MIHLNSLEICFQGPWKCPGSSIILTLSRVEGVWNMGEGLMTTLMLVTGMPDGGLPTWVGCFGSLIFDSFRSAALFRLLFSYTYHTL